MDALRFQAPSGGVMRFQCFAPHIHTCPLIFPRQRRRDRMRRISIQREGHPNLTVTGIPKEIPDVEAWMAERAAAAPVAPAKAE